MIGISALTPVVEVLFKRLLSHTLLPVYLAIELATTHVRRFLALVEILELQLRVDPGVIISWNIAFLGGVFTFLNFDFSDWVVCGVLETDIGLIHRLVIVAAELRATLGCHGGQKQGPTRTTGGQQV